MVGSARRHAERHRVPQPTRSPNGGADCALGGYYIHLLSNIDFLNNEELSLCLSSNIRQCAILTAIGRLRLKSLIRSLMNYLSLSSWTETFQGEAFVQQFTADDDELDFQ